MSQNLTNKNFMVSDAELDRWEDQPHKINLSAIREVCRELMKRRELDAEYRAEIDRLREALQQIITHQSLLTELADKTGASIIAIEALTTGNNH